MTRRPVAAAAALILLALALAVAYGPALASMKAMWDATPMYSFGYVVPVVAAFLVWTRRCTLAAIAPRADLAGGLATFCGALVLLGIGRIAGIQIAEQVSFVVALVAIVLLIWGRTMLRAIWLPIAYLSLMVPLWDVFTEPLHAPFQRLSARIGIALLQAFDIPVFLDGTFIHLPTITLEVARACSGVNYLVAVLALGVPLAHLYLPSLWRRVLLLTSAIAIAALSNGLRVALIGILVHLEVGSPLHGPAHVLHGLFVSGIGFVVLLVGLHWLAPVPSAAPTDVPGAGTAWTIPARRVLATALLFVAASGALAAYRPRPAALERPLSSLAVVIGPWRATGVDLRTAPWWQQADDTLRRTYVGPGDVHVEVAIGYFSRQQQGFEPASHLSAPLHRARVRVAALNPSGSGPAVNYIRLRSPAGSREGVFWYDIGGAVVATQWAAKAATVQSVLTTRSSAGLIVVVLAADQRDDATRSAAALADAIQRELAPFVWGPGPARAP